MIDDTRILQADGNAPAAIPQPSLSGIVQQILTHPVTRDHAVRWADNLRFLTFDDSDDESSTESQNNIVVGREEEAHARGQCEPCSRRVPVPSGHVCEKHIFNIGHTGDKSWTESRDDRLHQFRDPCVHVLERSCEACQHIPLFPNERKATRFRIRRLSAKDKHTDCDHFVAVSYCWSNEDSDAKMAPYKIVEENGQVRDARASNTTLDRVVAFARENGYRMIWIDQECIEQDNEQEKELAIQAMDYVYIRAHTSIGLFRAQLQQKHLDPLLLTYEAEFSQRLTQRRGRRPFSGCRKLDLEHLAEAVSLIVNDPWNSRAWVLQEAFASSGNMVLLFPRSSDCDTRGWLLPCHELSQSELAIRLDSIQDCLQICARFVLPFLSQALSSKAVQGKNSRRRTGKKSSTSKILGSEEDIRMTLKRFRLFHPEEPKQTLAIWVNNGKPRRTCNAAMALTYLQLRDLMRVADKLAIVANICGYDFRLDTTELEKSQSSLAICVLALAIGNGDFSLLVPQVYREPETTCLGKTSEDGSEFSWARGVAQSLQDLQMTDWNPFGSSSARVTSTPVKLSQNGLSTPGCLWKVDEFVDLGIIQAKYADSWLKIRNAKGPSCPSSRTIRMATTHLLFEIIEFLSKTDKKRLANSILNSTSSWMWSNRRTRTATDMIESVDQFPSGLRIENRKGMFALDYDSAGWPYQCWLIDRVMKDGGIWAGRLVAHPFEKGLEIPSTTASQYAELQHDGVDASSTNGDDPNQDDIVPRSGMSLPSEDKDLDSLSAEAIQGGSTMQNRGHAWRMLVSTMFVMINDHQMNKEDDDKKVMRPNGPGKVISSQSMAMFGLALSHAANDSNDKLERMATFDVAGDPEGNTLVLTPFQMMLESIPRPGMRAMSVSWSVEPTESAIIADNEVTSGGPRPFKVKDRVRGMWEFADPSHISGRYIVI
ncbi:hypothetical protein PFICI_06507 [Pestalotiopsis fici W106-1]|uniref:Heterokaryon incompatibility domain-containing protein n=1 Tax=Pestalotiopsis fici (strain W106-1 / CGMCC3.15140) TaxID=1229662 RepID=W3X628_PESFW|nr:uncharacterized protein PFICI_06507 [Pestalotiopsis fici W106-1]ETS81505.1 hypothetical protein PFICI_06507 [Pestalotiopsis fici W106-1]